MLTAPKTKGSRRTVKLSPTVLEDLRNHLERQLREIDQAGDLWRENGLIFASESGEPLKRHYITTHQFKPLLKRAGLPQIRFHDLRHTCATLLLSKNVNPKVVSEMLGHAAIAITLRHLQPRVAQHAERGRTGNGGRPDLARSGVKVVSKVLGSIPPGTFDAASKVPICRTFSQ
jgi:integrase